MVAPTQHKPIYTEEKAIRLINVFGAVLSVFFLIGWFNITILNLLKVDKDVMAGMDPTEIIATPFPLQSLTAFVVFPVVIVMMLWLIKSPLTLMSKMLSLTKLTLVIYALFGLCGDNMVKNYQHSLTAALYIATLASTTWTGKVTFNILEELPFYDRSDILATSRLYGMLVISIPFQVLSVLDRGAQIQRWPLPIVLGGTFGYCAGTLIGILLGHMQNQSKAKIAQS